MVSSTKSAGIAPSPANEGVPGTLRGSTHIEPAAASTSVRTLTHEGLSFVTETRTRRGRRLGSNYFDVPAEPYHDGTGSGLRAFSELLQHLQKDDHHVAHRNLIAQVLAEAGRAESEGHGCDSRSREGAATVLLRLVADCLRDAARAGFAAVRLAEYLERHADADQFLARCKAEERSAFVQRMREAKQRRRQASSGTAAHEVSR